MGVLNRVLKSPFPFYYGWAIVGAAFVEHIVAVGLSNSQGVLFKPILAEFGWTRAQLSGAFSALGLMAGVLAPFSGALADRYGPRKFIAMEAVLLAAGYALLSTVTGLWQFYLFSIVFIGLGRTAGTGSIIPTIPRWFEAKRGLSQGIVQAGGGLGTVLMPLLVAFLILKYDWRFAYIVAAVLIGVVTTLAAVVYRRRPQDMGLLPDGRTQPAPQAAVPRAAAATPVLQGPSPGATTFRAAIRSHTLWQLFGIAITAGFAHQLIVTHLVPHATDKGFSPTTAATFMAVLGVANMVGKLTMGSMSDYIGRKRSMLISFSLAVAMLLWLIRIDQMWAFYVFGALYGFAYGGWMPLFPTFTADLFGVRSLGVIYGTVMTSNAIGGALGTFLGGYIFDLTQSYAYAFLISALLLIAGIGILLSLRHAR